MIKTRMAAVFALILLASVFLCGQEVIEAIVAVVNDDIITLSQYKRQHASLYQMLKSQFQGDEFQKQYESLKKQLLNQMITDLLLLQEAEKREFNVNEQVRLAIENIKEENGMNSDEELRRTMRQQGIDFEEWKTQMEENFMKQNLIVVEIDRDISIDDSEIVNYYKLHPQEFTESPEYKLRAIYLSAAEKDEEEVEAKKKEIKEKIVAGEDLASLASQYSEGPEKETQGDLGSFKKGELEKSLEQAVEKLNVGQITSWIKVRDGWYLLKLEDKKESRLKSFEEVRKEIEEKLFTEKRQKKTDEFLKELKERSYIKILIPNPLDF